MFIDFKFNLEYSVRRAGTTNGQPGARADRHISGRDLAGRTPQDGREQRTAQLGGADGWTVRDRRDDRALDKRWPHSVRSLKRLNPMSYRAKRSHK